MSRGTVNTVLEKAVYCRAQVLSWQLEQKRELIRQLNIGLLVNLWPRGDSHWFDLPIVYWQCPYPESAELCTPLGLSLAGMAAAYHKMSGKAILVLCEAGKTRSVLFSAMVYKKLTGCSGSVALEHIFKVVPSPSLKPHMLAWLRALD